MGDQMPAPRKLSLPHRKLAVDNSESGHTARQARRHAEFTEAIIAILAQAAP